MKRWECCTGSRQKDYHRNGKSFEPNSMPIGNLKMMLFCTMLKKHGVPPSGGEGNHLEIMTRTQEKGTLLRLKAKLFAKYAAALVGFFFASSVFAADGPMLFQEDFSSGVPKTWKEVKFEGRTDYSAVKEGTNTVLKALAKSSATGIAAEVNISPQTGQVLSWRWKIDKIPAGSSDNKKATFDHTARIFVAFKSLIGPPRTINYVWANQVPVGKTFEHPSSGRSQWIALQNGNDKAGQWQIETRDITADWKLLFGDDKPPQIVGIGLMTDSDGTAETVTGFYDDIKLIQTRK